MSTIRYNKSGPKDKKKLKFGINYQINWN